jgi:hypothetical protein
MIEPPSWRGPEVKRELTLADYSIQIVLPPQTWR